MKFKVGDKVIVTAGKDKGRQSEVVAVLPQKNQVVVAGANLYTKHVSPMPAIGRSGEIVKKERPLHTAKVAIINDQGNPDRIGYTISQSGDKQRIFKKTGKLIDQEQRQSTGKSAQSKSVSKKSSTKSAKSKSESKSKNKKSNKKSDKTDKKSQKKTNKKTNKESK